jgi:predicted naringenin-chalcone synthase
MNKEEVLRNLLDSPLTSAETTVVFVNRATGATVPLNEIRISNEGVSTPRIIELHADFQPCSGCSDVLVGLMKAHVRALERAAVGNCSLPAVIAKIKEDLGCE